MSKFTRTLTAITLSVGLGAGLALSSPLQSDADEATPTPTPTATATATPTTPAAPAPKPKPVVKKKAKKKVSKAAKRRAKAVRYAKAQIGDMYGYGATGPRRFDCSGLMYASYRYAGKRIPRTSGSQLRGLKRVSIKNIKKGDIVVYYGGSHVGMYVGNGKIVHSSRPGRPIKIVKMRSMPIKAVVRV